MLIKCVPLGAGQDVGKSCVIVTIGGKNIMFDCGMHMGYQDERRYPKFSYISKNGNFTQNITCVIITHFHLDHVGALPYFTEVLGYNGPIYMTYPTKALSPLMLEDYRKVLVDKKGEQELFSVAQIHLCMKKVTAVNLKQTIRVDDDLEIRAYYAGHVLGAAMFHVKVGNDSAVYTGDYNMTPDRHLGAAQIDPLEPDLLITESTYATTVRDSKRAREREFLKKVHGCVKAGGKVLIPVFALGRAQIGHAPVDIHRNIQDGAPLLPLSLAILSTGLTVQANVYYKLLISWTNQKAKDTFVRRNMFDFKHVSPFDSTQIDAPGPCVLFASPGMLSGGLSLEVFKHWAPSELNMVVVPGFCVTGTVGNKLMSGKTSKMELDKRSPLDVKCQVHKLSFSAHTDAKGIMDLVKHVNPRHVVLVHGEKPKMTILKERITSELGMPCFDPANYESIEVPTRCAVRASMSKEFVDAHVGRGAEVVNHTLQAITFEESRGDVILSSSDRTAVEGVVVTDKSMKTQILHLKQAPSVMNIKQQDLTFSCEFSMEIDVESANPQERSQGLAGEAAQDVHSSSQPTGTELSSKIKETPPMQKKFRMDLIGSSGPYLGQEELQKDQHDDQGRQSKNVVSTTTGVSLVLDMNLVPDSQEMEVNLVSTEPSTSGPPAIPSVEAVLDALYVRLKYLSRIGSLKQEGKFISSKTFSLHVSTVNLRGPSQEGSSGFIQREFPPTSNEAKEAVSSGGIGASIKCSWSHEDDALACSILDLLRRTRLKVPQI